MKIMGLGFFEIFTMGIFLFCLLSLGVLIFTLVYDLTRPKKASIPAASISPSPQDQTHSSPTTPSVSPDQVSTGIQSDQPVLEVQSSHPALEIQSDQPVLETWKTQPGFTALGIICSFVLGVVCNIISSTIFSALAPATNMLAPAFNFPTNLLWLAPIMVLALIQVIYLLFFYPTFFGPKPRISSSKVISFANGAFGGGLFGLLWNRNLTAGSKGAGYIAMAILALVEILLVFLFALGIGTANVGNVADTPNASSGKIYVEGNRDLEIVNKIGTATGKAVSSSSPQLFIDTEYGLKFFVPKGWEKSASTNNNGEIKTTFAVKDQDDSASNFYFIRYGASDLTEVFNEYDHSHFTRADLDEAMKNPDAFVGMVGESLQNCNDEEIAQIEVDGQNYLRASGTGTVVFDDARGPEPTCLISYITPSNGIFYEFSLFVIGDAIHNPDISALEEILDTVQYPAY